jgi:hypothetical protein
VGDRGIIFNMPNWKLNYRRYVAALVESFNKFMELRGVPYPGTFTPSDVYSYCLVRQQEMKTTANNIASVFGVIVNFLIMRQRLESIPWGTETLKNFKDYLKSYSRNMCWSATKAGVIGKGLLRTLPSLEKFLITFFIQTAFRDASIESIGPDDVWCDNCPFTKQPCVMVNVSRSKTWPAYKATGGVTRTTGIVSLLCNCDKSNDGPDHEFCVVCHGRWKAVQRLLPLPHGTLQKILSKIDRTPHSLRRSAATMTAIADARKPLDVARWNAHFFWSPGSGQRFEYAMDYRDLQNYNFMPSRGFTHAMDLDNDISVTEVSDTKAKVSKMESQLAQLMDKQESQLALLTDKKEVPEIIPQVEINPQVEALRTEMKAFVHAVNVMKVSIQQQSALNAQGQLSYDKSLEVSRCQLAIQVLNDADRVIFSTPITTDEQIDDALANPTVHTMKAIAARFF